MNDTRVPLVPESMGAFAIYRTPEQGHTAKCLANALICAVENLRDDLGEDMNLFGQVELTGVRFRVAVQSNMPLQWADEYLASGTCECLCDPIPVREGGR